MGCVQTSIFSASLLVSLLVLVACLRWFERSPTTLVQTKSSHSGPLKVNSEATGINAIRKNHRKPCIYASFPVLVTEEDISKL